MPDRIARKPVFYSRADFAMHNNGTMPQRHRVTIFPDDVEDLSREKADILITHEAPSVHKHGFQTLDRLAETLGARLIVHGHHHLPYEAELDSGIKVIGLGLRLVRRIRNIEDIVIDRMSEAIMRELKSGYAPATGLSSPVS